MTQHTASPLSWPARRPRTAAHKRRTPAFGSGFSQRVGEFTIAEATRSLTDELARLGVRKFILSTNLRLRGDGLPISNQRAPDDPAAAVYFDLARRETVIACDRWAKVQDNIFAIAKHIDALRGQDRWGCGTVEQAFAGYAALPPPGAGVIEGEAPPKPWRQVLQIYSTRSETVDDINVNWRRLVKEAAGDEDRTRDLNIARQQAREELSS